MTGREVLNLYKELQENGIEIWIDGGWCVDALLGKQTREHPDLDVAVHRKDAGSLKTYLQSKNFQSIERADSTEWNFVLRDSNLNYIDVHVFEYDADGKNIYGIEYPFSSLTGAGVIEGKSVNCVSPEFMFKFKTSYVPAEKDIRDVQALSEKFGFVLPDEYQT